MNGQHFRVGPGFTVTSNHDFSFWQLPLQEKGGPLHLLSESCGVLYLSRLATSMGQPVVSSLYQWKGLLSACRLFCEAFPTQLKPGREPPAPTFLKSQVTYPPSFFFFLNQRKEYTNQFSLQSKGAVTVEDYWTECQYYDIV